MTCKFYDSDEDELAEDVDFDDATEDLSKWDKDLEKQASIEKNIKLLEDNRDDIQTVNDSMLRISGLLLTASLTGLYFIYNNSHSWYVGLFLFSASIILAWAIFTSISALELKPRTSVGNEKLLEELQDAHSKEDKVTRDAFFRLEAGIILLIIGLILFALDSTHFFDMLYNSTLSDSTSAAVVKISPVLSVSLKAFPCN